MTEERDSHLRTTHSPWSQVNVKKGRGSSMRDKNIEIERYSVTGKRERKMEGALFEAILLKIVSAKSQKLILQKLFEA